MVDAWEARAALAEQYAMWESRARLTTEPFWTVALADTVCATCDQPITPGSRIRGSGGPFGKPGEYHHGVPGYFEPCAVATEGTDRYRMVLAAWLEDDASGYDGPDPDMIRRVVDVLRG